MNFQKIHKPFFRIISFFTILHHILFPLYAGISHSVNVTGDGAVATIVASSEDQLDQEIFRDTKQNA